MGQYRVTETPALSREVSKKVRGMENAELADWGLRAYHAGDFEGAIKYLSDLKKGNPGLWQCRLYLGMAYCRISKVSNAIQEFKDIAEWCPDHDVREKALVALRQMNRQSQDKLKTLRNQKRE